MGRATRPIVAVGAAAAACALLGTACSLILDFDDPPPPPDAQMVDAIPAAACDFGEPNDSRSVAFPLTPGEGQSAGICTAGDRDFYSFAVADGEVLDFAITFAQEGGRGDLDMRLLDADGTIVARSLSTDPDEAIVCPGTAPPCVTLTAGNYFIEVFGFSADVINGYTINFTLTGGAPPVDAGVDAI